jgi:ABC-type dipeptide/oligopeptide/nickel transport system permease subunit
MREPAGSYSQTRAIWQRLRRNHGAVAGLAFLIVLISLAILAPLVAPADPLGVTPARAQHSPDLEVWLGADHLGRDILSRLLYGARISLTLGLISVTIAASFGTLLGLVAGYYGGRVDLATGVLIDVMLAFPGILLALAIVTVLRPGIANAMIAVGIAAIPTYTRLVRGSVLAAKNNVYVEAARVVGCRTPRILWLHILPNVLAPLIVLATLGAAQAILAGAALSFLGLGAQPPTPEWGLMLSEGRRYIRDAWWNSMFPGVAIMLTVLAINLLGDGLRDALDPRLK